MIMKSFLKWTSTKLYYEASVNKLESPLCNSLIFSGTLLDSIPPNQSLFSFIRELIGKSTWVHCILEFFPISKHQILRNTVLISLPDLEMLKFKTIKKKMWIFSLWFSPINHLFAEIVMEGRKKRSIKVTIIARRVTSKIFSNRVCVQQSFPLHKLSFWFAPTNRPPGLLSSTFGS